MKIKSNIISFILLFFAICDLSGQNEEVVEKSPNFIFIVVDDLGWSDLGVFGADLHETPNIDAFAAKSMVFTSSYAAGSVCSPTRASIMTGKTPAKLNYTIWSEAAEQNSRGERGRHLNCLEPLTHENLPLNELTIAEILRENNYLTAHIGKWHIGDLMHFPNSQGFDVSVAASQRGAPPTFFHPYTGIVYDEFRFVGDLGTDTNGSYFTEREGEYLTDRLTHEAMKIIEDAGPRPFFLNLSYYSVHIPIEAKPKDISYFKNNLSPEYHHQNETYAAMVKNMDDNIGRLLNKINDLGISNNTVIIFTSDNGGVIQEYKEKVVTNNFPLREGKGSLYEGGIRIPTIVYDPRNPGKGREIDIPISTIDYLPTILDIARFSNELEDVEGVSFLPVLKDEENKKIKERALFWHFPHNYYDVKPVSAIRHENWKLLEYLETGEIELYNLANDLGENNNLADKNPRKLNDLLERLHAWKKRVNAKGLRMNAN